MKRFVEKKKVKVLLCSLAFIAVFISLFSKYNNLSSTKIDNNQDLIADDYQNGNHSGSSGKFDMSCANNTLNYTIEIGKKIDLLRDIKLFCNLGNYNKIISVKRASETSGNNINKNFHVKYEDLTYPGYNDLNNKVDAIKIIGNSAGTEIVKVAFSGPFFQVGFSTKTISANFKVENSSSDTASWGLKIVSVNGGEATFGTKSGSFKKGETDNILLCTSTSCSYRVTAKTGSIVSYDENCTNGSSSIEDVPVNKSQGIVNVYACKKNGSQSSSSSSTNKCVINVKSFNNFNSEKWYIYDNGKLVNSGDANWSFSYSCTSNNCYIKYGNLNPSRTFNGIAGNGDCSDGGRRDSASSGILECLADKDNGKLDATLCYLDMLSNKGGTYTPVIEPTVDNNSNETLNGKYYAKDKEYMGTSIKCGDKLFITTCTTGSNSICDVTTVNGFGVSSTTKIYKSNITKDETQTGCFQKIERYITEKTYYYSNQKMSENKTEIDCGSIVTFKKSIENSCYGNTCEVEYNGKTIYIDKKYITSDKPTCINSTTCETSSSVKDIKGEVIVKICDKDDNENTRNNIVTCAEDYAFEYKLTKDNSLSSDVNNRYKEYKYTCNYVKRPMVSASAGIINSKGLGTINATGYDFGGNGIYGFFISPGEEPTANHAWISPKNGNTMSIEESAGTYFIWVKNYKHRISYPVLAKVYDSDLSTTLSSFSLKDDNGNNINMSSLDNTVGYNEPIKDSNYALLSNSLLADSVGGFDKYTTAYEMTVSSSRVALYATLTSSDAAYVSGFEPRTIDLEYGRNVALIKIVNKDGKERCYTFIINRVDDRNNSNLLKNVKLSRGSIDFDPYTTNYDVKISRFTKKVSVNAELDSSTSTFIKGNEPREVEITEDRQSVVLKVISEAGSIRSYVITFIRNGEEKDNVNSTYLSSLTVPGTMLGFDKETYDYTITVPYETEDIPVYAFAEDENATVNVGNNTGLKVGNNLIQIEVKNNNKTRIYSLHVIRKESGLDISNSARLGTLSIKNYNIEFNPDKLDYQVKIKREKTLLISATPESNRADIYMYGNNDLTGFSTVRVKVIAENGLTNIYSIDIQKDAYNKKIEIIISISICLFITISGIILIVNRKNKVNKEYMEG